MKAIFQSKQSYLHLSKGTVNSYKPVTGQAIVANRYVETGKKVGDVVTDPTLEAYTFMYGADHNQITLTDPTEIENMRAYINRRHDNLITEVFFEE